MRVIACYSMKGGVGKTASSVNLAYWAAQTGIRTLLIDLDLLHYMKSVKNIAKKLNN